MYIYTLILLLTVEKTEVHKKLVQRKFEKASETEQ